MLDNKLKTPFIALIGAIALAVSAPAFAQNAPPAAPAAANSTAAAPAGAPADANATAPAPGGTAPDAGLPPQMKHGGKINVGTMFIDATLLVKVVMVGLALASIGSWTLMITKAIEFRSLNRTSDNFLEAFRGAKSIPDMGRIAQSEEFEGNPMADMAAAAAAEVELSRQA